MRLLVTGASGFLGRNLLPRLAREGYGVSALLLPGEPEDGLAGARVARGDVTDAASLRGAAEGCDGVVHLAGAVGYGQTMERCRRVNTAGTRHVAAEAVRAGARRFVQMSSVSVYGRVSGVPIDEDFPLRRTGDPYGDTKIEAEEALAAHARRGELALTVLRPVVIYGPGDDKFLPRLVENLRSGRARIVGDGRNRVDALHVDDAVEAVLRVLAEPRAAGRVYNLSQPRNPSWGEFVPAVAAMLGVPPPRGRLPWRAARLLAGALELDARLRGGTPRLTRYAVDVVGRPYDYRSERARSELGFEPRVELLGGVRRWLEDAGLARPGA